MEYDSWEHAHNSLGTGVPGSYLVLEVVGDQKVENTFTVKDYPGEYYVSNIKRTDK
jgi:hypothetical protein